MSSPVIYVNKKGVLNIPHVKMTFPILRWRYFQLTDPIMIGPIMPPGVILNPNILGECIEDMYGINHHLIIICTSSHMYVFWL